MRVSKVSSPSKDHLDVVQYMPRTVEQIDADIGEYLRLLDTDAPEREIQTFLCSHTYFFNGLARNHVPIFSQVKLGADYVADFAYFEPGSLGTEWHFVEIERASTPLCKSNGTVSARLNHAIEQARDWKEWLLNNRGSARKTMPLISYPFFYVFAGRRETLNPGAQRRLQLINYENRHWLEVGTLDRFASCAQSAKSLHAGLQLNAYTFKEMKRGEPKASFSWLRGDRAAEAKKWSEARLLEERVSVPGPDDSMASGSEPSL